MLTLDEIEARTPINVNTAPPAADAMHGEMRFFSLIVVRIKTDSGATGMGYTYTVGKQGASAVLAMIRNDLAPLLEGADPRRTEQLWKKMWWRRKRICSDRSSCNPVKEHTLLPTTRGNLRG